MLMASLFLVLGTAWAQTRVLKLTDEQIGTTYPYALTDEDAAKVFGLTDLTIAVKVNTPASLSGRRALFCTSDPTKDANTSAMGTNSHYVAYGLNGANSGYLASCVAGDRYTAGTVSANTEDVVLVYVLNPTNNKFIGYINKSEFMNRNFGSYEIATPKMVKEDYANAKIYIGGGVKADKAAFETFNGTITGVEVYDGVLTAEQVANVFPVEFAPEAGKMYALKESSTGLFLDIQTLGINEPNANGTTNNISLNIKPCIIYFEAGAEGKWKMKNANGSYVHQASSRDWNAVIGSTAGEWIVSHAAANLFTIARADGKFVGADTDKRTNKAPLYCDCDDSKLLKFSIVEYSDLNRNYCVLKSPSGTYLSLTQSGSTKASFQSEPAEFYITPSAELFYLNSKANTNNYVGFATGNTWDANLNYSLWSISEPNDEGLVQIVRSTKDGKDGKSNLGHDGNTNKGTGIYTNVGDGCFPWQILEKVDYATTSSVVNNKNSFTSDRIWYTAPCNTLRFTLTSSGAYYNNDKNKLRLSFDSFELYDANGKKVALAESSFSGNNTGKVFANMLDGANGTYCAGTWASGIESDWFELTLPNGVDLGGAFSFSYVTESGTHFANPGFRIDLSYKKLEKDYTFTLNVPNGIEASVTYDGKLVEGPITIIGEIDPNLIIATEISGYTWSATVDEANGSVSVTYTEAPIVENPEAVVALVKRIGGDSAADKFKFVLDPSINSKQETFVIGNEDGKILIKGSTLSAITTGLGWYLNNIAHINIAWNSLNEKTVSGAAYVDLTNIELPLPAEETHTSDAKYRYYLNTCTFGYSMTSWTWKRWQQEIDWMALHGINMPLQLVGLEEVWRTFLTMKDGQGNLKYGYTDEEAKAFVAGPAFIAWWAMNNLEGWGGTAPGTKSGYNNLAGAGGVQDDAWYVRQRSLARQIVEAQRALGMQPVIPGWSGMVPTNFQSKSGFATRGNGGKWAGDFVRPLLLNVNIGADKYAEIAADYYACLHAVMGESQYYSMDPFHEGGGAGTMEDYTAMYEAMEKATPGSQWVIQQWQWTSTQRYSLTAVPEGRLVVLDLFADGSPAFDKYNGYAPQDAVFCTIPNFGGRSGLMGRLQNVTDNYFNFKAKYASIKGIGAAPEAIEQTPITYDLIFQLPWMDAKPDVAQWVENYAIARYGKDNKVVKEAWSLLRQSVLAYGADGIEGPIEDVWAARPNLVAWYVSSWGSTLSQSQKGKNVGATYTPARRQMLIDAVYKLISQKDILNMGEGSIYESNYLYDIVEFAGGVMADYAHDLLLGINTAKTAAGANFATDATYIARRDAFLQLIRDMDTFRGTNLNFRLGKWTQEARAAAAEVVNPTSATPDWYEYNNARTIVSTWSSPGTNLTDYSYRSWQGLLKDYYLPRWEYYFKEIEAGRTPTGDNYKFFEWNWAHGKEHYVGQAGISNVDLTADQDGHTSKYTREPEGNTVEAAVKMLGKYIIPITMGDDTYYAYRTLINELSGKVTIYAPAGATPDFAQYLGVSLEGATTTGDAAEATAAGTYTATITLPDGTVLKDFAVVLQEYQFNGYYHIKYENQPLFIGYNEENDDWVGDDHKGYKILGAAYTTDAEADKVFAIVPNGNGYSIAAQGKYLKAIEFNTWRHIQFSDNKDEAGEYVFHEVADIANAFKIQGVGENDGDWVHNDYMHIYNHNENMIVGPNPIEVWENGVKVGEAPTFTITPAETYNVTLSDNGFLPLCLPFNVVLPEGVEACDINDLSKEKLMMGSEGLFTTIATTGQIVKAGTPMILKGTASASYALGITLNNNGAKTSLPGSVLRGNYVKQTVTPGDDIKKYVLNGETFEIITSNREIPANSCWVEANIEGEEIELVPVIIEIKPDEGSDDASWKFRVKKTGKDGLTITDCVLSGGGHLKIDSHYEVDGEFREVNALSDDFLHDNWDIEEVTLPSTLTSVGGNYANYMFEIAYKGADYGFDRNVGVPKDESDEAYNESVAEAEGWVGISHPCHYKVLAASTWRMTVDVKFTEGATHFNDFGSCLFATKENTLSNNYNDGSMQLYLRKDKGVVFKLDSTGDIHVFNKGNEQGLGDTFSFTFVLDNNGAGAYTAKMIFENGAEEDFIILADDHAELHDFNTIWSSLGSGVEVNVQFDKLTTRGLFVGCKNLKAIHVDDKNESFSGCNHGVLYNKLKTHVIRFPEGGGEKKEDCHFEDDDHRHFELPRTVTKIYAGALHDVNAHIIFHSNPLIMSVEDPDDPDHTAQHVTAKYHLVIEDDAEVVDFHSGNTNMYQTLKYKRAPLAKGTYGTIVLPFAPDNATKKYDFFELYSADAEGLIFSQVDEVKANTPYLYKLKDVVNEDIAIVENEKTIDVFTGVTTQIQSVGHNPSVNKDEWESVGCYVTESVMTETDPANHYYYFSIKENAFLYVTKKLNVKPYRAFFVVPATTAAQAPAQLSLRITRNDGSTTEIDPSQVEGMETPIYYDLQGRRVENPTSGVYIVNGKKVVIR